MARKRRERSPQPALPPGKEPNPRKRNETLGRDEVLKALSRVTSAELEGDDFAGFYDEIRNIANPRGAALLLGVHLEQALEVAIERRLRIVKSDRTSMFGFDAPMGTFDRKIRVAHAVHLLTDTTRGNLDVIRRIRNAFAHAIRPLSFETKEIADACNLLQIPVSLPPTTVGLMPSFNESPSRERYRRTCETTAHNLFVAAGFYTGLINRPVGSENIIPRIPDSV